MRTKYERKKYVKIKCYFKNEKKERNKEGGNSHCQGLCSLKSEHVLNFVFLSGKTLARSCKRCMPSEYRIRCNTDTHGELVPSSGGLQTATQEKCYQQSYCLCSITSNGNQQTTHFITRHSGFGVVTYRNRVRVMHQSMSTVRHYVKFLPTKDPVYNTYSIQLKAELAHRLYMNSLLIYCVVYRQTVRRRSED